MGQLPTGLSGRQVRTALERAGFDSDVIGRLYLLRAVV